MVTFQILSINLFIYLFLDLVVIRTFQFLGFVEFKKKKNIVDMDGFGSGG